MNCVNTPHLPAAPLPNKKRRPEAPFFLPASTRFTHKEEITYFMPCAFDRLKLRHLIKAYRLCTTGNAVFDAEIQFRPADDCTGFFKRIEKRAGEYRMPLVDMIQPVLIVTGCQQQTGFFRQFVTDVLLGVLRLLIHKQISRCRGEQAGITGICHNHYAFRLDPRKVACDKDRKSTRLNSSHVKISYAVF